MESFQYVCSLKRDIIDELGLEEALQCLNRAHDFMVKEGIDKVESFAHILAFIYSQKVHCLFRSKRYADCIKIASKALKMNLDDLEVRFSVARCQFNMRNFRAALKEYLQLFYISIQKNMEDSTIAAILGVITSCTYDKTQSPSDLHRVLKKCAVSTDLLLKAIRDILDEDDINILLYLSTDNYLLQFNLSGMNYSKMLKVDRWKMTENLVINFIHCGADLEVLRTFHKADTFLHAALEQALVVDSFALLQYLLKRKCETEESLNVKNREGNTILHTFFDKKLLFTRYHLDLINMMMENGVSPLIENGQGRLVIDNLLPFHTAYNILYQYMLVYRDKNSKRHDGDSNNASSTSNPRSLKKSLQKKQRKQVVDQFSNPTSSENVSESTVELKKFNKAMKSIKKNNYSGYKHIVEIINQPFRNEFVFEVQMKAQNFILENLAGSNLRPDKLEWIIDLPEKLIKKIIAELVDKLLWSNILHILDMMHNSPAVKQCLQSVKYSKNSLAKAQRVQNEVTTHKKQSKQSSSKLPQSFRKVFLEVQVVPYLLSDYCLEEIGTRAKGLHLMLSLHASPCTQQDGISPIQAALRQKDYSSLPDLIFYGASPSQLTLEKGDTPFHAAVRLIPLMKQDCFSVLEFLIEMYNIYPDIRRQLDPLKLDKDGNNLLHSACTYLTSEDDISKVVSLLSPFNLDYNLRNKMKKTPLNCLVLDEKIKIAKIFKKLSAEAGKEDKNNNTIDSVAEFSRIEKKENQIKKSESQKPSQKSKIKPLSRNQILIEIEKLINDVTCEPSLPEKISQTEKNVPEAVSTSSRDIDLNVNNETISPISDSESDNSEVEDSVTNDDETQVSNTLMDLSVFDDLTWEVECTSEVWKVLHERKLNYRLKMRIVSKVQQLARGEWTQSLCRPLITNQVKGQVNTRLYEIKLSKGARVIWENALAFSPRRSRISLNDVENVLRDFDEKNAEDGLIYSEIIRIWSIVFDHDNLEREVNKILKSHIRGSESIIRKKLYTLEQPSQENQADQISSNLSVCLPKLYSLDSKHKVDIENTFYPPANSVENQYNIMKFYSFSSALVKSVLHRNTRRIDFPFRVTEREHKIIDLKTDPPTPVILLGRSGTGKTTCCLYRMWSHYLNYWIKSNEADAPLLPREIFYTVKQTEDFVPADTNIPDKNNSQDKYDHFHQVFITKNPVLCDQIQKNFRAMANANKETDHYKADHDILRNSSFQDVLFANYPLFLTMRNFLVVLDASLPGPFFFDRKEDKSFVSNIDGWSSNNTSFYIPYLVDDTLEDNLDINAENSSDETDQKYDPRREVTYAIFLTELWPQINQKMNIAYHPSLVWMEIVSFIQGSVEALSTEKGFLSLEEYLSLGKKRAPNFTADRSKIYDFFIEYRKFKHNNFLFDESNVIFHLYNRLHSSSKIKFVFHEIYVDETQDFTQAELSMLIRCCQNPNDMFFTGDTAQSIMRGVSFRFEDLKTLFYYAKESMKNLGKTKAVEVPKKMLQLVHNYRSHAGILKMASSVVDILEKYFSNSFDHLERDVGMFNGPQPILLESCSFSDLALMLAGNKRQTAAIEFGAHQVIIVANEESRMNLPEELSLGLVLTIFESKGLEFDDILLYNFFKDSQANSEWRVVIDYLNTLLTNDEQKTTSTTSDKRLKPRPLEFDPNQHKILNSELKQLYTAITRSRVNIWIYDESEKRAPMFEYFKRRQLVQVIKTEELKNENISLFAKISSSEEWQKRGDDFMKHNLYEVAVKCYEKCDDKAKLNLALANNYALQASRIKDNPNKMRTEFLRAAMLYLKCNTTASLADAEKCLMNARENLLAADLMLKLGLNKKAALLYQRAGKAEKACAAFEAEELYSKAIDLCIHNQWYERAILIVRNYETKIKSQNHISEAMLRNGPNKHMHSMTNLVRCAARYYLKTNEIEKMKRVLKNLSEVKEEIKFLIENKFYDEMAAVMIKNDMENEVSSKFCEIGEFEKALEYATDYTADLACQKAQLILKSSLNILYKNHVLELNKASGENVLHQLICAENLLLLHETKDRFLAEVQLLIGIHTVDDSKIEKAEILFRNLQIDIGIIECVSQRIQHNVWANETQKQQKILSNIDVLLKSVNLLKNNQLKAPEEKLFFQKCASFFGVVNSFRPDNKCRVFKFECPKISSLLEFDKHSSFVNKNELKGFLSNYLEQKLSEWINFAQQSVENGVKRFKSCNTIWNFTCKSNPCFNSYELYSTLKGSELNDFMCSILYFILFRKKLTYITYKVSVDIQKRMEQECVCLSITIKSALLCLLDCINTSGSNPFELKQTTVDLLKEADLHHEFMKFGQQTWKKGYLYKNNNVAKTDFLFVIFQMLCMAGTKYNYFSNYLSGAAVKLIGGNIPLGFSTAGNEVISNFKYFVDQIRNLHSFYGEPFHAIDSLISFMIEVCKYPSTYHMPSCKNICMMLEFGLMHTVVLVLNNFDTEVLVPKSFQSRFANMNLIFSNFKTKLSKYSVSKQYTKNLYSLIRSKMSSLFECLFNINFDLLDFQSNWLHCEAVDIERLLVLVITILINSSRSNFIPETISLFVQRSLNSFIHTQLSKEFRFCLATQKLLSEIKLCYSRKKVVLLFKDYLAIQENPLQLLLFDRKSNQLLSSDWDQTSILDCNYSEFSSGTKSLKQVNEIKNPSNKRTETVVSNSHYPEPGVKSELLNKGKPFKGDPKTTHQYIENDLLIGELNDINADVSIQNEAANKIQNFFKTFVLNRVKPIVPNIQNIICSYCGTPLIDDSVNDFNGDHSYERLSQHQKSYEHINKQSQHQAFLNVSPRLLLFAEEIRNYVSDFKKKFEQYTHLRDNYTELIYSLLEEMQQTADYVKNEIFQLELNFNWVGIRLIASQYENLETGVSQLKLQLERCFDEAIQFQNEVKIREIQDQDELWQIIAPRKPRQRYTKTTNYIY